MVKKLLVVSACFTFATSFQVLAQDSASNSEKVECGQVKKVSRGAGIALDVKLKKASVGTIDNNKFFKSFEKKKYSTTIEFANPTSENEQQQSLILFSFLEMSSSISSIVCISSRKYQGEDSNWVIYHRVGKGSTLETAVDSMLKIN